MRRLNLTAAAIVSTAVLLTTTSVLAIAPAKVNLGTLKPQGGWKVGTVNQGGDNYCAMVGTYGNKVIAAFARNPQGLGSLALDFGDAMFTPGKQYDVSLSVEGAPGRTFPARASTERSLVVQIGQDGSFYDALSKNGTLGVDMSVATLRLDLVKFADSHKDLVTCAGQLTNDDENTAPKQRLAELPVDRELAALSQARTTLADASTKADDIQKSIETKASSLDAIEAQLEAEARAEIERSKTSIASIDTRQTEVRQQLAAKGVSGDALDLSVIEPAAGGDLPDLPAPQVAAAMTPGGRKLLAAIGGSESLSVPPSTGSSSRDIEAREMGLADSSRAAEETARALELKNEIASIEAEKNAEAQAKMAAFDVRQKELEAQGVKLSQARDTALSKLSSAAAAEEKSKKLRADVIAQQAKIADVSQAKQKEAQALPRELAQTQSDFAARIAALETERNQLRDQVNTIVAENERLKKSAVSGKPEDRLEIAQLKKQMLDIQTQRQAELARATVAQKELDDARQQIAGLRQNGNDEMARLSNLQRTLEADRAQLNTERSAVAKGVADTASKERAEVAALRQTLEQKQVALEAAAVEQGAEAARLQSEKDELAASKAQEGSVLASTQQMVETERKEMAELRTRIKTLEGDLVKARAQTALASAAVAAAPQPVPLAPVVDTGEIARLKDENTSLRQRLANMLTPDDNKPAAVVTRAVPIVADAPVAAKDMSVENDTPAVETVASAVAGTPPAAPAIEPSKTVAKIADKKGASPVLASLFGKRLGTEDTAAALNAAEPAAGAPDMPAVPPAKVETSVVKAPVAVTKTAEIKVAEEIKPVTVPESVAADIVKTESGEATAEVKTEPVTPPAAASVVEPVVAEPVKAEVQPVVPQAEVSAKVETVSGEAELEIARMAPITESVPVEETVHNVPAQRATMRRAQDTAENQPQDKGVFGIFGRAMGYSGASDRATTRKQQRQQEEATQAQYVAEVKAVPPQMPQEAIIRVTHPSVAPAPAAAAPLASTAGSEITQADGNRAAAFLDNIMAFHRPTGSDATGAGTTGSTRNVSPADTGSLNAIETAAGSAMDVPAPRPAVRQLPVAAPGIGLDAVLRSSGMGAVQITTAANGGAQWTTGTLNGMYETTAARGGFDQQVDAYLARYQDDCPGQLSIDKAGLQPGVAGAVRNVDMSCAMNGNSYATSIVFSETPGSFNAILHAGQAGDKPQVKRLGDMIASELVKSGVVHVSPSGLTRAMPASFGQQPAALTQATERPRFRVEIEAPSATPESAYDLPTTIVE